MATIGDLTLRVLLDVVQATKEAENFGTSLKTIENESKKVSSDVKDASKSMSDMSSKTSDATAKLLAHAEAIKKIRMEKLKPGDLYYDDATSKWEVKKDTKPPAVTKKPSDEIEDIGKKAKKTSSEVGALDNALSTLGSTLKVTLIVAALDLIYSTLKDVFTTADKWRMYQDRIDETTKSIGKSSDKIQTLTNLQTQFANYTNLNSKEQNKLNAELGKAVELYPEIVAGITSTNGALILNADTVNRVIEREKNLADLRRELFISDQASQIKNLIEQYKEQIKVISDTDKALENNGQYLKENHLIFNAFGNYANVIYDVDKAMSTLRESLVVAKNESANLQIKFLDAIQQGLKFGDVDKVLNKIKIEIGNNTGATKIFFDTIAQLTGQGIDNWDSLRNALVNYKNELASVTTQPYGPEKPTPNVLSKSIQDLKDKFNNESDASKRKEYAESIKSIQIELDKMNGKETKTSSGPSRNTKDAKELLTFLEQINKELEEVNTKISLQSEGESKAEGLFAKKTSLEQELDLIHQISTGFQDYIKIRAEILSLPDIERAPEAVVAIPEDKMLAFRIALQDAEKQSKDMEESFNNLVSDLSVAYNFAAAIANTLTGSGKDFMHYVMAALQLAIQTASLIKKGNSKEGIGFMNVLGAIGTVLPFFFESGGVVPGPGSTDTVPAWLTPGESVLNKAATDRLGPGLIQLLNRGGGTAINVPQSTLYPAPQNIGGGELTIVAQGELTDHLNFKIVDKGMKIRNVRKVNTTF